MSKWIIFCTQTLMQILNDLMANKLDEAFILKPDQ